MQDEPSGWTPGRPIPAVAKAIATADPCPECKAIVNLWDGPAHKEWHELHDGGPFVVKEAIEELRSGLRAAHNRINQLLDGVVRLR